MKPDCISWLKKSRETFSEKSNSLKRCNLVTSRNTILNVYGNVYYYSNDMSKEIKGNASDAANVLLAKRFLQIANNR